MDEEFERLFSQYNKDEILNNVELAPYKIMAHTWYLAGKRAENKRCRKLAAELIEEIQEENV